MALRSKLSSQLIVEGVLVSYLLITVHVKMYVVKFFPKSIESVKASKTPNTHKICYCGGCACIENPHREGLLKELDFPILVFLSFSRLMLSS